MALPHSIDWSKLAYAFDGVGSVSVSSKGEKILKVYNKDRERLFAALVEAVRAARNEDARRYAGALGNPEEGLIAFSKALVPEPPK